MVIILVTLATPISSHVKDKNCMFTACDEDMIFLVKGEILVFHRCLCNKERLCLETIGLIVAPWKSDVLETSIFALS